MLTPFCVLLRSEPNAECDVGEPINGVVAGFPVFIIEMIELPGYVDEKIFPVSCNRKASVNVVVNVSVCRFFPVARTALSFKIASHFQRCCYFIGNFRCLLFRVS